MTDHTPVSAADLAELMTLTNLTVKSLLKVQEAVTRELQTRVDTEQLVEAAPPPSRRVAPIQHALLPHGESLSAINATQVGLMWRLARRINGLPRRHGRDKL